MRFRIISRIRANLDASVISLAQDFSELRGAPIQLFATLRRSKGRKQMQVGDDAEAGLSRLHAVDLSQRSPLADSNPHSPHLPSRTCAVSSSQGFDSADSRWRC